MALRRGARFGVKGTLSVLALLAAGCAAVPERTPPPMADAPEIITKPAEWPPPPRCEGRIRYEGGTVYLPPATTVEYIPMDSFTIPAAELLGPDFAKPAFGPAQFTRTATADGAVRFDFRGLTTSATAIKDDYPVDTGYGQIIPSHGNGDFSRFNGLALEVTNLDDQPVSVQLFVNTGFTGVSGKPSSDLTNDTFWRAILAHRLAAGERDVIFLAFDMAVPLHVEDNKPPHTSGKEGEACAINAYDRTEISAIGLLIWADDNHDASVLLRPCGEKKAETPKKSD